ncbi:hypothetical protein BpHYR1_027689 [Brachionus plicatilis]|uniref:Uncharacterized protein n=1 Tax=Brachionus plicatilis TaxID=10195 RepID=A0A3M7QUS4_BRAPC|nr:hypothetical protein BpHYR1_027689 [Brachionus plicatilis]
MPKVSSERALDTKIIDFTIVLYRRIRVGPIRNNNSFMFINERLKKNDSRNLDYNLRNSNNLIEPMAKSKCGEKTFDLQNLCKFCKIAPYLKFCMKIHNAIKISMLNSILGKIEEKKISKSKNLKKFSFKKIITLVVLARKSVSFISKISTKNKKNPKKKPEKQPNLI